MSSKEGCNGARALQGEGESWTCTHQKTCRESSGSGKRRCDLDRIARAMWLLRANMTSVAESRLVDAARWTAGPRAPSARLLAGLRSRRFPGDLRHGLGEEGGR